MIPEEIRLSEGARVVIVVLMALRAASQIGKAKVRVFRLHRFVHVVFLFEEILILKKGSKRWLRIEQKRDKLS